MAGKNEGERELRVLVADYEISPTLMGPIPGGNDTVIIIPGLGVLGTMTSLDRLTYTYNDTNGYNLEIKKIPEGWGDLTVEQYRIDNNNNMALINAWTINKKDRNHKGKDQDENGSVTVSGGWVHAAANPPIDPVGVAQGIDMIVVHGSTGRDGCH